MAKVNRSGTSQRARRPRHKLESILGEIRGWIISGQIPLGGQLPTREKLIEKFKVSSVTIQRALDQLTADGFVYARPRHGTFVSDHPPHLFHYGLVFSAKEAGSTEQLPSKFWLMLANLAMMMGQPGTRRISLYFEVDEHLDTRDGRRLREDVQSRRIAGLILAVPRSVRSFIVESGLPCVSFNRATDWPSLNIPNLTCVDLSLEKFLDAGIKRVKEMGCKRVAFFVNSMHDVRLLSTAMELSAKAGVQSHRHWMVGVDPMNPHWVRGLGHLIFSGPAGVRPDAVVVLDDHLSESLCQGIDDAGLVIGKDVQVVSYANFPAPPKVPQAVELIGFEMAEALTDCLDIIDRKNRGQKVPNAVIKSPVQSSSASRSAV